MSKIYFSKKESINIGNRYYSQPSLLVNVSITFDILFAATRSASRSHIFSVKKGPCVKLNISRNNHFNKFCHRFELFWFYFQVTVAVGQVGLLKILLFIPTLYRAIVLLIPVIDSSVNGFSGFKFNKASFRNTWYGRMAESIVYNLLL